MTSKHSPVVASAVENQAHCDFVKLRNMLIRTHMHDLKDVTCDVHYENYRAQCIQQMTRWVPTASTGGGKDVSLSAELGLLSEWLIGQEAGGSAGDMLGCSLGNGSKIANPSVCLTA